MSTMNVQKDKKRNTKDTVFVETAIPCRARGMQVEHNFKTAHFIITEDIKHGEELVCSFPACRDDGVKFRYCLYCRVPVAKRNFRMRHHHIEQSPYDQIRMAAAATANVATSGTKSSHSTNESSSSKNGCGIPNNISFVGKLPSDPVPPPSALKKNHIFNSLPVVTTRNDNVNINMNMLSGNQVQQQPPPPLSHLQCLPVNASQRTNDNIEMMNSNNKSYTNPNISRQEFEQRLRSQLQLFEHNRPFQAAVPILDAPVPHDSNKYQQKPTAEFTSPQESSLMGLAENLSTASSSSLGSVLKSVDDKNKLFSLGDKLVSHDRLVQWSTLLARRPDNQDGDSMSAWLMSVLAISNLDKPIMKGETDTSFLPNKKRSSVPASVVSFPKQDDSLEKDRQKQKKKSRKHQRLYFEQDLDETQEEERERRHQTKKRKRKQKYSCDGV